MNQNYIRCIICAALLLAFSCKKDSTPQISKQIETTITTEQNDSYKEKSPPVQTPVSIAIDSNIGGYLEALPASYAQHPEKRYPLIIYLHGVGELGNGTTDLHNVAANAIPKLIANEVFPANFTVNNKTYQFIVLSPQFKVWPDSPQKDVNAMLDYALQKYRIDSMKMYVCGISMGGGSDWIFTSAHGKKIAAVVPICGAAAPNEQEAQKIAGTGVSIWAFHNNLDPTIPVAYTIGWVNEIDSSSPRVPARITIFNAASHDAWTEATDPNYKEKGKNIYEWMLSKRNTNY